MPYTLKASMNLSTRNYKDTHLLWCNLNSVEILNAVFVIKCKLIPTLDKLQLTHLIRFEWVFFDPKNKRCNAV